MDCQSLTIAELSGLEELPLCFTSPSGGRSLFVHLAIDDTVSPKKLNSPQ
jgi:hypothetical protein